MGAPPDAEALFAAARTWADGDCDPDTRETLRALIAAGDEDAVRPCMTPTLKFGTAGLRGLLGPGPAQMNRAVVARTTAGLCAYLLAHVDDAAARGLCVGYDARHGSEAMAHEAAAVARGAGLQVHLFEFVSPTPALAFAVLHCNAAGGVMVTASHNPPAYNGFKVYGPDGAQITAPMDARIAEHIAQAPTAIALPRVEAVTPDVGPALHRLGDALVDAYLAALQADCRASEPAPDSPEIAIAYTPLHGVGGPLLQRALQGAGVDDLHLVDAQARPDPNFPTVTFPNPEEPGAMDAVLSLAARCDAALALANDPDADRLAVAARDRDGVLRMLTGNQLGLLLCDHLLRHAPLDGRSAVVTTIVSTEMLAPLAAAHRARCHRTLTGFKWIMRRAAELQAEGMRFVFGFEEALGYAAGTHVRDKDGILAARLCVQLARACAAEGQTLWDRLHSLYKRFGYHHSGQHAVTLKGAEGAAQIADAVERWRQSPPDTLCGLKVSAVTDYRSGIHRDASGQRPTALPSTNAVRLQLQGGHWVCVRPSGTEPKLKLYFETVAKVGGGGIDSARARADALARTLEEAAIMSLGLR